MSKNKRELIAEISEIRDIIASAKMGTWRIELVEDEQPRMFVDKTMKELLGIEEKASSPEQTYIDWFSNINESAVPSVLNSVERMKEGKFDENTYLWNHPKKGTRYVRCGGISQALPGGYSLRGYHYDVDEVVREDQAKVNMLRKALDEKNEYYATLGTLEGIFYSMHVIDLVQDTVIEFNSRDPVKEYVNHNQGAVEMMRQVMAALTVDECQEIALEFSDLTTLADRIGSKKIISKELVGRNVGWFLASFIAMERDRDGKVTKVIYTTRVIDEEKKQEEKLIKKAQTDELTGLLNRRAYEDEICSHHDVPEEDDFIYISLDVNALKVVNDTLGHVAGDELLVGASKCMKRSIGPYGKLYRTGGDEFAAVLFCDEQKVKEVLADFDDTVAKWSGKLVDRLSVSYGWISKYENEGASVRGLANIADQRMYQAKAAYYQKSGVDRRGQQEAHKALCALYTKILKVNLSEDSYQIIDMKIEEQIPEKGFSPKISKWLELFGKTGQVHPDDLAEYLKKTNITYINDYFAKGKTSLHIFYRRKYEDDFKQVMMEMIPAGDYSENNHSFFLYVKEIDK